VNGPRLDADGKRTGITWFSAPQDQPVVRLAFSYDGGANFTTPIRIDEGNAIGRAQVVLLPGHSAVAFWLEHQSGVAWLLARIVHENGVLDAPVEVSRGEDLGYPHAARATDGILITWAEGTQVRRVHVSLFPFATRATSNPSIIDKVRQADNPGVDVSFGNAPTAFLNRC
jgi:hypothetical protein